jgi:aminoglycoside N3'-acetyltransferase
VIPLTGKVILMVTENSHHTNVQHAAEELRSVLAQLNVSCDVIPSFNGVALVLTTSDVFTLVDNAKQLMRDTPTKEDPNQLTLF